MKKVYPKIVIIGNTLNLRQGGGITLFNLLRGWDKSKISIVANKIDEEGIDICTSYYRLGFDEFKRPWPVRIFQPYYESTAVILEKQKSIPEIEEFSEKKSKYNKNVKTFFENLLHFLGIYYYLFPLKLSPKFMEWLDKESPQLIYTQLTSPDTIYFMKDLMKKIEIPLYIHIMDDWPKIINKPGLSNLFWNKKIHRDFKWLMNKSTGLLSICDSMSEEYKKRYKHDFKAFHNCIDIEHWGRYSKTDYDVNGKFVVLYAGRIGLGTYHSILTFAKAIEKIQIMGVVIEFQIQTGELPNHHKKQFSKLKRTKVVPFVDYNDLPKKLSSVDLLLLPMDFDEESLKFIQLSMPTKVPEYMSTGVPIFVFADKFTALFRYAKKDGWAFTFSENDEFGLAEEVKQVIENKKYRIQISKKAKEIAYLNHEGNMVREEFRKYLLKGQN